MAKKPTVEPNLLDRVIGWVSPKLALERTRYRGANAILSGYVGARYDRTSTTNYFVTESSADTDTVFDLPKLRGRSRDLVRNTPIATGAVATFVSNTIGSGLSLKCTPDYDTLGMSEADAEKFCDTVEKEFRLWAESANCDITRTMNFYGLQALAFRSLLESGDVFALLPFKEIPGSPYQLRIQLIEADRVESPNGGAAGVPGIIAAPTATGATGESAASGPKGKIVAGVELDDAGAPIAYHIANRHPSEFPFAADEKLEWNRYPAFGAKTGRRNVLHIFDRLRPGQTRGVPLLAPVIGSLRQLDQYTEAELTAAVVTALFTVFIETPEAQGIDTGYADDVPQTTLVQKPGSKVGMGAGSMVDLAPGEKASFADPKRPNGGFDPFVTAILRQIGVAIGLPYEILVKHFTASYSASRAAILQAWQIFKQRRDFISTGFCDPVYEAFMEEAVALDRIDAPGFFDDPAMRRAYLACEWVGDAPSQIDPLKEIQAAQLRMETGVSTLPDETMELTGKSWEDNHRVSVKVKAARVAGLLEAPITAAVQPKVARGEGLDAGTKTDPNLPPTQQPAQGNGSDLETGDLET